MINWQSILSSFDDKPTLLEWLKKVQKALNESALTTVTVSQEKTGRVNSITLTFNFQDGTKIVAPAFTVNDGADGAAGIGMTDLVNTNLTNSNLVVTYDTIDGLHVFATQNMSYSGGNHASGIEFRLPIMSGNGINISKRKNAEEIEIKVDQSKSFTIYGNNRFFTVDASSAYELPEGSLYTSYGDESGTPTINHKDPSGTYKYIFPANVSGTHRLLSDNNVKNLFGKSIVGEDNINLYRHVIKITGSNAPYNDCFAYLTIPSSKNLDVKSLADLKILLGYTFEYPATGYDMYNLGYVYKVTQDGIISTNNQGGNVTLSFANMTVFRDTVTTV